MTAITPLRAKRDDPAAARQLNQAVLGKRARVALERRLDQLEAEHATFTNTLIAVERAVRWLPETHRARARRRLRELGHDHQLDPFEDLDAVLDDAA